MDTQTTYRGYVIRKPRWSNLDWMFHHSQRDRAEDPRHGRGTSEQDCRDQIDHQIADAMALSDRDGGEA